MRVHGVFDIFLYFYHEPTQNLLISEEEQEEEKESNNPEAQALDSLAGAQTNT
jgi:hypothetical protein